MWDRLIPSPLKEYPRRQFFGAFKYGDPNLARILTSFFYLFFFFSYKKTVLALPDFFPANRSKAWFDGWRGRRSVDMSKVVMSAWLKDALYALRALVLGAIAGSAAGLALDLLLDLREPHFTSALAANGISLGLAASIVASLRRELAKDKNGNTTEPKEERRVFRIVMPVWIKDVLSTLGAAMIGLLVGCAVGAALDILFGSEAPVLTILFGALGGGTGYAVGITNRLRSALHVARASTS